MHTATKSQSQIQLWPAEADGCVGTLLWKIEELETADKVPWTAMGAVRFVSTIAGIIVYNRNTILGNLAFENAITDKIEQWMQLLKNGDNFVVSPTFKILQDTATENKVSVQVPLREHCLQYVFGTSDVDWLIDPANTTEIINAHSAPVSQEILDF